ncbi:LysR family transcriptional regulator [Buttiauxella agrestis]|uniref:LysR family transcriptional regulator n=1 Tax=Buttiauxella agrestis TaxID=82977 RepID=UPI003975D9C0
MPTQEEGKFDYNLIHYLVTIVETSSMVSAAEVLGVAPSVVSYAVKKLRDHYGDPLFVRSLNGVKPTSLAMNLYQKFKLINNDIIEAINLKQLQGAATRKIFIQTESLTELWITEKLWETGIVPEECLVEFCSPPPTKEQRSNKLRSREVDMDIGFTIQGDSNIVGTTLYSFEYVIICRQQHKTVGDSITLEQFSQERYLGFSSRYSNTQFKNDYNRVMSSRILDAEIRSESAVNILLATLSRDLLLIIPKQYSTFIRSFLPFREVKCDFFQQSNTFYNAHIHKQNIDDALLNKIVSILREPTITNENIF